jgi:3-methyladenine DNA glycosylase/8-oxoguanine DNA glycosylase
VMMTPATLRSLVAYALARTVTVGACDGMSVKAVQNQLYQLRGVGEL